MAAAFAAVLLVGLVLVVLARLESRRLANEDERFRREAAGRNWTFGVRTENRTRVRYWTGTTDGIRWQAESRRAAPPRRHRSGGADRCLRWWADTLRGPSGAVLFLGLPEGAETPSFAIAEGSGALARMAQHVAGRAFDRAVDLYFGADAGGQVNAATLKKVDGGTLPGYIVMAADSLEGARRLATGMRAAMHEARHDLQPERAHALMPWVLQLPRRISIARMDTIQSTAELERLARAGAALVRCT